MGGWGRINTELSHYPKSVSIQSQDSEGVAFGDNTLGRRAVGLPPSKIPPEKP